jgi:hypothetical protein
MHLELGLARVLIPYASVVGLLSFFTQSPSSFPQKGVCWKSCRDFVMVQITSFLSSERELEFLLFDGGMRTLLKSHWEMLVTPAE